ncbi:MAG: hypothetical protein JWR80_6526 [Bradyrhizobium sp.]|nr:hypothetical protein [Bradyrhizobium sp.]
MKPDLHCIPLTAEERIFLLAILDQAIELGEPLTDSRSIISLSPARPDGLIEVTLNDNDRECIYGVVSDSEFLDELGVRARISKPYFRYMPSADHFLGKKAEGRVQGLYIERCPDINISASSGHALFEMFGPFAVDRSRV